MPPNGLDTSAITEAFRRRMGAQPSTAGLPTGQANLNPQAQTPQQIITQGGNQGLQPLQNMSEGGVQQLQKSAPGEAEIILKALIQRLRNLGERGQ